MDMLKRMESRLLEEDRRFLQRVYAPQVVAVPPRDAAKSLCLMPDGEIRIYGVADKKEPDDEGRQVYIASGDCGLSWKTHETPEGALGAATCNPETGRWITFYPLEGRRAYPAEYPTGGSYVMMNDGGPDAPPARFARLSDETLHFQKQPYYFSRWKRWILPTEVGREGERGFEKFIAVSMSDDDGLTWRTQVLPVHAPKHAPAPPHKGPRWQDYSCEPTIAELSDGTLWMLERTSQDFHYQRFSRDGGETWTDPEPSIFHGTLTMPVLYRLSDGRIVHFWCGNQPLPENDHAAQWPPLNGDELSGRWEDVFTNRDVNHLAITGDDGRTWIGFRELYLNALRNRADFRSVGGVDSRDKSVHQGEMLELPFGKLLVSFGQNAASRKAVLLDPAWLYEDAREEDFRLGLDNVTTHMYVKSNSGGYRGFSGHCAWNRTNGALLAQDPDGNFEEALRVCRVRDERLVFEKQGAVWNFPAAKRGEVSVRLRVEGAGVRLCLTDHWYNACDETVGDFAPFRLEVEDVAKDVWHDLIIRYDAQARAADALLDGRPWRRLEMQADAPYGLCYLHIQTLAEAEDFRGTYIKRMAMRRVKA